MLSWVGNPPPPWSTPFDRGKMELVTEDLARFTSSGGVVTKFQRPPVLAEIGDRVKNRPPRQKHDHLEDDDKILILFGTSRAWTIKKMALTLPASQTTVKNFRTKIFNDPISVFELPVLIEIAPKTHQCRLCGESRGSRTKAMRHVLAHILPEEIARGVPLDGLRKPL